MTAFKNTIFTGLLCLTVALSTSCTLFSDRPVSPEKPSVTVNNLKEIKEVKLDSYGFNRENAEIKEGFVKRNESLYLILRDLDVSPGTIYRINEKSKGIFRYNRIKPGQRFLAYSNTDDHKPVRLILHQNPLDYIVFDWENDNDIEVTRGRKPMETTVETASGVIQSSLYETLQKAGHTTLLANSLSEVFAWQVDFFRLYPGDSFKVIYEQHYVDGKPYSVGDILAAEFTNKGQTYEAYYYEGEEKRAYYDSEGSGVQKALLKTPFKFNHWISSGFSYNRFHPVQKVRKPHYGVDYAAPLGTPVLSVGDGVVTEARYRGASGNLVKIRHNGTFTTAYLHLNGFASGIRRGVNVKQGQVIGYVGKTGRVTGVHLDYRIYRNGRPVNPLTVKLPSTGALEGEELEKFYLIRDKYRSELDEIIDSNALASGK